MATLDLPQQTANAVDAFLADVCEAQSTVPSVTTCEEEGTAILHWLAGPMSIEVEVGFAGPVYFWAVDEEGIEHSSEGDQGEIVVAVRHLVAQMARRVAKTNPTWVEQYNRR